MPAKQVNTKNFIGKHLTGVLHKAPRAIAVMGVNQYKQSFRMQRFNDTGTRRWQATKSGKTSGILIGKQSGMLRDSIQTEKADLKMVKWTAKRSYAKVHNKGGIFYIKPHKRTSSKGKRYNVRGHAIKMPQRKFMGRSKLLEQKIDKWFNKNLNYR